MTFDYSARQQRLTLNFSSSEIVSLRITVNDNVRITQCRTTMAVVLDIDVAKSNTISVENLTTNSMLNIDSVILGLLNITPIMHKFAVTCTKATNEQFGRFVSDLGSPDIMTITFDNNLYRDLLPSFIAGDLVP